MANWRYDPERRARQYAERFERVIRKDLGFGYDGIVFSTNCQSAIKALEMKVRPSSLTCRESVYSPNGLKCDVSPKPRGSRRTSRRPQGARLLPPFPRDRLTLGHGARGLPTGARARRVDFSPRGLMRVD